MKGEVKLHTASYKSRTFISGKEIGSPKKSYVLQTLFGFQNHAILNEYELSLPLFCIMNKASTLCYFLLVEELSSIAALPLMQYDTQSNQTRSSRSSETFLDYNATPGQEHSTVPQNAPGLNQYTTAVPGVSKNLIKSLAIVIPICLAIILTIVFKFSKKKLAERRVRKFHTANSMKVENRDSSNQNSASVQIPNNPSICTLETTVETNSSSEIRTNNETGHPEIILNVANLPSQTAPIKPSLKKNTCLQHFDSTGFKLGGSSNPEIGRSRQDTRPVSADFGSGICYMRKSGNKLIGRNENKRHSCAVVMESFTQSESSSQSRVTIIENLAYEDLIPSQTGLHQIDDQLKKNEDYIGIPCKAWPRIHEPRSVQRRQEHQYETITCSSSEKNTALDCTDKFYPGSGQDKRETKSDDQAFVPCLPNRTVHQNKIMTVPEKDNTNSTLVNSASDASQLERKTTDDLNLSEKQEEKQKLWPPPTLSIKRKVLSPNSSEENKFEEEDQNVHEKVASKIDPTEAGDSHLKITHKISNNYQRLRSKSDPYATGKRTRRDSGAKPKLIYFPTEVYKQSETAVSSATSKKAKLPSKWRKAGRGKNKQTAILRNQVGSSRVKAPPEAAKQRRRSKRKVRKKRKSRDELRQKLQLRLMGYDSGNIGINVGTGESYKTDNNERASGFVAGPRWKLEPDRSCLYSTDTSEGDWGITRMRRPRVYSHDEWCKRWADRRINETTLLEEIWRHLNVIAERSRLLKDSSSSRRRSQSLTSSDSSPNQRRLRRLREGETDDETLSASSDESLDEGLQIEAQNLEESTSDNGYCTYSHLPVRLRHPPTIPEDLSMDAVTEGNLNLVATNNTMDSSIGRMNTEKNSTQVQPESGRKIENLGGSADAELLRKSGGVEAATKELGTNINSVCKDSKVIQTSDQKINAIVKSSIYEKLTEFCSLSSSVSSSCSSLSMPSQISIPQMTRLPKNLQSKISDSSEKTDKNTDENDVNEVHIKVTSGRDDQHLPLDDVITAPPNSPTMLGKNSLNMENSSKTFHNLADVIVSLGKYNKVQRRSRSDSNYVVVPPSTLLRKTLKESSKQSSSEKGNDCSTEETDLRGNISKHFAFSPSPECDKISDREESTIEVIKTDIDSTSGNDEGNLRVNVDNCEEMDDVPLHVFMEMTM